MLLSTEFCACFSCWNNLPAVRGGWIGVERPGDRIRKVPVDLVSQKTLEVKRALDREEGIRHSSVRSRHHNHATSTDAQEQQVHPMRNTIWHMWRLGPGNATSFHLLGRWCTETKHRETVPWRFQRWLRSHKWETEFYLRKYRGLRTVGNCESLA